MRHSLLAGDRAVEAFVRVDGLAPGERIDVYRNTFLSVAARAVRLNFPAVARLVGDAFFDAAARAYATEDPPQCAWLDSYGAGFPKFLAGWPAAHGVPYLADVARLEWAVACSLHAPDAEPIEVASLAGRTPDELAHAHLVPHPSLGLVHTAFPADAIWRAVLAQDDAALAAIDLASGPRWLVVHRSEDAIDVSALREADWRFTSALWTDQPLDELLAATFDVDAAKLIAQHLAAGRFTLNFETAAARRSGEPAVA